MRTFTIGNVPCGDCRMCCQNEIVPLEDTETGYEVEVRSGKRVLAHKENKDCWYLTAEGCGIYHQRPRICREFDCRVITTKVSKAQAVKLGCGDAWKKGRKLLEKIQS
jgi:Fe-S-cluster containining protein